MREQNIIDWESYCTIDNIKIDQKTDVRIVLTKLLKQAIFQILNIGEIYIRLFLNTKNINQFLLDDYKLVILSFGFIQISISDEGIMFSFDCENR